MKRYFILISMLIIGVLSSYAQQTSAFTWATGTTTFQPSASTLKLNGVAFKDNQNGVIVGSDGKVYRTTNGGSSWIAITNPVASLPGGGWFGRPEFRDITYIGNNSYFAVASAGKVMKSTNGGESWDTITITPQPTTNNYMSVAYNNGIVFIGGEAGKLFKGTNNGQNWTQINDSDFGAITFNDICVVDNNTMYIAGSVGRVFKSTDGGESWSVIRPSESLTNQFLNIAFKDANNGIVVGASGKVFKTNNGGNTWIQVENVFGATDIDGVIYKGNTIIVVGQGGQAWSSIDNGVTWQANNRIGYFARFSDLAFLNNNTAFAVGMSGGAFRLENITINNSPSNPEPPNSTPTPNTPIVENTTGAWTSLVANLPAGEANTSHYALAFSSPQVGVIVSAAGKVFRTTNGGDQWINVTNPIGQIADNPPDIYTVNCDEQGVYYAGGGNGNAMKSTNNGTMWESMTIANGLTQGVMRIATRNDVVLVSAGTTKYRSDDNGDTWGIIQDAALGTSSLYQIYFANDEIVYAVSTMGNIFKSNNAGLSWSSSRGNINTTTTFNSVAFKDAMNGIVVGRAGNAYITDDGGTSWTRIQNVFGNTVLNAVAYKGDYIVVMGAGGNAWISYDNGANWTQSNPSGAYSGDFKDVRFIDNNKAIAVGFSGGVYKLTITPAAPITPTIAATPNAVNFTANPAGTQQVTVTSNSAWTVSENIEWLTVTPTSGSNNGTLTLTATANTGAQRSGIVTLQAGTATQTINVTQAASAVTPPPAPNLDELAWTTINSTNFIPAPPGAISEPSLRAIGWATAEIGFAGGDGGRLYKTTDGGDTWNVVQYNTNEGNNPAIYDIYFANATEGYAALGGGHVMSTNDGGTTWTRRSSGVTTDDLYTVVKVGNAVFFGGFAGRVIKSTDNGITFENVTAPTGGMDVRSSYVITNTIFLCGENGMVIKSTDGGLQWSSSRNGITDNFDDLMSIHFRDADEGYIVGQYGAHYKTIDGGANWSTFTLPESGTTISYTLNGIDFNGQRGIIVGANGKAWTTENGGDTWTYGKPNVDQSNTLHAVAFSSENNAVAVGYDQSIYRYSQSTTLATTLTVNPTEVNFAAGATGSQQVTVTSNSAWTVSENIEWLTVTPMAGNNNGTLTLTATANTLAQARTGIVTVTAGTGANAVTQTITVTQAGTTTSVPTEYTWTAQTVQNIGTNSLYGLSRIDAMNAYAVGTNKTIIKTMDGGINWTPVENNLTPGTGIYAVHFISNDVGYIARTAAQIAKTTDYGATWSTGRVGTGTWRDVYFTNATTGYACGTSAQVAKTTNGTAWEVETVSSYGGTFMAQKVLNNGNIIAVGTSGGIYKKSNNDWGRLPAGLGTASITFRDVDFKDNNVGIVVGDGGFILRTTGGGDQWTRIQGNNVPSSLANKNLKAVCFADANTVYIGGEGGYMLKSTDAGATWSEVTSGTNKTINNIAFYSDGTGIAVCDGATVLRYGSVAVIPPTPQTGAWTAVDNDDMMYPLNSIYPVDANTVFAVGMHNYDGTQTHVFKSTNQGTNWTNSAPLNDEEVQFEDVWFRNASSGFIVGTDGTVLRTSNGGTSWTSVLINGLGSTDMKAVRFPTQSTGYIAGLSGKVFKSTNSGNTWTRLTSAPSAINFVDMHFVTDDLGYLVGQGIVKTTNGGATWTTRYLTNTSSNDSLQGVYFTSAQVGYVVGNGGRAYKTVDGGTTWVPMVVSNNGDSTLFSVYFVNDNLGYVTNKRGGIFKTTNAGLTWTRENTPTTEALYKVRFLNANLGYAVGAGGTALRYTGNATPAPTLTVDPANMQFAATAVAPLTAQQQPVTITTNNNWNATVSQGAESWLSVLPGNGTSAVGAAAVIAQNNTGAARTGTVTINAGGLTQTITVNQAGVANPPALDPIGTWVNVPMNVTTLPLYSVFPVNESTLYTVSAYDGDDSEGSTYIIKSENAGNTWTSTAQFGEDEQIDLKDICFRNATSAYIVGTDGAILKKSNNGWLSIFIRGLGFTQLNAVKFPTENTGYIVGDKDGTQSRVYKTIDGETWARLTSAPLFNYIDLYFVTDELGFMVGERIVKTIDGGTTWTTYNLLPTETNNDLTGVYFTSDQVGYVVGNGGKAYKTSNGGTTWEAMTLPELDNADLKSVYFVNATEGYIVGHGGRIYQTRNGGTTWARQTSGINTILYKVRFLNENVGYAVGASGRVLKFVRNTPTPTLAVDRNEVNFQAANATNPLDQQTTTITVTSNRAWTVTENIEWLSVNPENGTNNGTFVISVLPNTGDQRTGTVTVTAGTLTQTITVNQAAGTPATNLTVDPTSLSFVAATAPGSGEIVNVTSNTNWTVTASLDWISVFPTAGNNNGMFMVSATANTGAERTGNITVSGGGVTRTITVTQAGTAPTPTTPSIVWELKNNGTSDIATLYGVSFPTSDVGYAVGTSGRVYKTTNRGEQWNEVVRPTTTSISGVYFYDAEIGVVVSDNRILRTTNGGTSWTTFTPQGTGLVFNGINGHGQRIIAVGGNGLIMRTNDGGVTWDRVNSQAVAVNTLSRVVFATEDTVFIAGARGRVFKSVDGGINWSSANTGITSLGILRDIYFKDGRNGIVVGQSGTKFKTSNGGTSWQQISTTAGGDLLAAAGKGDVYIFTNNGGGSFVSFDNRETWGRYNFQSGFTQRINDLDFADANTVFAVGSSGRVYRGTISGITPPAPAPTLTVDPANMQFAATAVAPLTAQQQPVTITTNNNWNATVSQGAESWLSVLPGNGTSAVGAAAVIAQNNTGAARTGTVTINAGGLTQTITVNQAAGTPAPTPTQGVWTAYDVTGGFNDVYALSPSTAVAGGGWNQNISRTTTSGDAWTTTASGSVMSIDFVDSQTGFAAGRNGNVKKTTDGGVTWTNANTGITGDPFFWTIDFVNDQVGYVGGNGAIYKTINGGAQWTSITAPANGRIYSLFFVNPEIGYAAMQNTGVYKTTNGGASWQRITSFPQVTTRALHFFDEQTGYVTYNTFTERGIKKTTDGGETWVEMQIPQIPGQVTYIGIHFPTPQVGYACGWQGGIVKTRDGGATWTRDTLLVNGQRFTGTLEGIHFADENNGYCVGDGKIFRYSAGAAPAPTPTLTVNPTAVNFNATATAAAPLAQTITVTANNPWTVTIPATATWLTATPANGTAPLPGFVLTAQPNTGEARNATVTVTAGTLTQTITVNQAAGTPAPTPTEYTWSVVQSGTARNFTRVEHVGNGIAYASADGGVIMKTIDGGRNWNYVLNTDGNNDRNYAISFPTPNTGYVAKNIGEFRKYNATTNTWNTSLVATGTNSILWQGIHFTSEQNGVIVGSNGKIYYTITGGTQWLPATLNETFTNYFRDVYFTNNQTGYAVGALGRIFKTTDGGVQWNREPSGTQTVGFNSVHFAANGTLGLAAGNNGRISRIDGNAWEQLPVTSFPESARGKNIRAIRFVNENLAFVAGEDGKLLKSIDRGLNWVEVTSGTNQYINGLSFDSNGEGIAVCSSGVILRYGPAQVPTPTLTVNPTAVNFNATATAAAPLTQTVTVTSNSAWTVSEDAEWLTVAPMNGTNNGTLILTAQPNTGVERTATVTVTAGTLTQTITVNQAGQVNPPDPNPSVLWTRITEGIERETGPGVNSQKALTAISAPTNMVAYAGGTRSALLKTVDGGTSWAPVANPFAGIVIGGVSQQIFSMHFTDAQTGYAVGGDGNVMRTVDGGTNWTLVNPKPAIKTLWAVSAYGNSIIASGYNGGEGNVGNIRRSTDGGVTWETITSDVIGTNGVTGIHFVNANLVMASGQSGKVYKSVDGGATWALSNTGITSTRTLNHIYFKDPKNGYVVGDRSYAYKTTDGGDTWTPVDQFQVNNGNRNLLGVAMHGRAGVIVGGSGTAWTTTDGGATWVYQKPEEEFTLSINKVDFFDYQTAIAAGHDLRVFRANFSGLTPPPALTLSQETMELPATAAPQTVTVTTPSTWTTYADVDWLTVVPVGQTLTVTALPNTGAARRGVVTVLAGTDGNTTVKYITVNQDSPAVAPELAVTPEIVQLEDAAGAQTITVTSNANWTVTETAPWIDITTPNGTNNGTFTINATANTNATARNAVVTVTAGTITNPTVKTITVNQAGATIVNPSVPGQWVAMENVVIDGDLRTVFAIDANKVQTAGVNAEGILGPADANLIYSSADKGVSFVDAEPIEDWTETINDLFFVNEDTGFAVAEDGKVLKTIDGGINWQNTEVSQSALKAVRFVSESLGYVVGNDGKLYKTNDASDWTEVPTSTAINFKSAYFVNANCGYLVGNGIVRYNSDDNITVQRDDNTMLHGVYFFNENKGFAVGENSTVLKTINGGLNWTPVTIEGLPNDVTLRSIYFADAENGHIVGDGGRIYKTSNGGRNWVLETSSTTNDLYSVHFFNTETGYAVGDGPKFLRYIAPVPPAPPAPPTAQEGWTVVNAGPEQAFTEYKAIKFRDSMNGIAVGVGHNIARTNDGGITWTTQLIPDMGTAYGLYNLRYVGDNIQLADNISRVYKSADNGVNWTTIGTAQQYWFNNVCFINEQTIIGGSIGRVDRVTPIRRTTNGGTSWTDPIANPGLGQCNDFDFVTEQIGWAVGNSATVMKTTDGGLTWTSQNPNIPTDTVFLDDYSNNGQLGAIVDVDFVDEQTGYICGFDGKILKSTNGGTNWTELTSGVTVHLRGIYALSADVVYAVGDNGTILKTTNGGNTWTAEVSNTTKNLHEVYFLDENNGYAVGDDRTIVKYHHTPIEWVALSSGVENANASLNDVHFLNDRVGYIVGSNGVGLRKTNDAGVNWTKITTNFDNNNTNKVFFVDEVNGFVAPSNDLLKHTTSSGENWDSYAGSPLGATDIYAVNENIAYATHTNGRIYRLKRTPNENTWYGTVGGPDDPTLGSSGGSKALHLVNSNIGYALVFNGSNDFILKGTRLSETSGAVQDVWSDPSSGTMFFPRGSMNDIYFVNENLGFVVGNNGAVKMTTNGGARWSNVSVATVANLNKLYFRTATEGYIVGDNGTILRTEDGGSTWRIDPTGVTANLKSVHSANGMNVIYVVGENNTLLRRGTPALLPELAVNPEAHTFAALATANEPLTKTIEVTCNVDWTVTKNVEWLSVQPASGSNNGTFTITAEEHFVRNPRTGVVTVSAGGITKEITITQEAGEPLLVNGWNVITTDPNATAGGIWANQFTHISFKDDMHGFVSGPNGKVAKTVDGGKNWTISDYPVANVLFYGLSYTNTSLRLAQNNNVIRKSTDDGITWTPIGTPITDWSFLDEVVFVNDNIVIASTWGGTPGTGPQRVKRSSNGGLSWDTVHTNGFAEVLKFDFINDRVGWGVGYKGTVVKTTDAGRTWTEQATPLPRNTTNDHISCLMGVDFVDANIGYAAGHGGKIIKTTNGGQTWIELNSGSDKYLYDIKAYNADIVLAVGAEGTILRSLDGGNSWNLEPSQTTEDLQEVYFLDDKNAVAVGNKRTILRYKNIFTPMMNVDPAVVTLEKDKDSEKTINVTANQAWTVADDAAWLDLDVTNNANNNGTVKVIANSANNTVENRVATVTFTMNQVVKTVTVTQKPSVSYLTINYATKEVPSAGEAFAIEITSNDAWTITDDAEWVTVNPATGNNNANITVTVAENAIAIAREATVTFTTANNATKTLKITQVAAGANLVLSTDKLQVDANSSSNAVTITSNVVWTASVDATYDWISVLPANGMGNGAINVVVNANTATTNREGVVTVSGGGMTKTIQVKQSRFIPEAKNWTIIPTTVDNDFTSVMMPSQNTAYITGWSIYQGTSNEPAKVLKTTNNGDTWTNYTPDPTMLGGYGFNTVYFTDNQTGHVAGFSSKYGKTEQGAADWNVREITPQSYQEWGNIFYSVDFINSNIGMMVGLNWNVYKTDNGGATWVLKDGDSARPSLRCVDFVTDQVAYVVGDKKTIRKTTDGGNTWATQSFENTDTAPTLHGVHFINERVGHVVGFKGTYGKTTDGGQTWTWTNGLNGYNNLLLYSVKFVNATKGYIVGANGKIFKTTNGGANWVEEASGTDKTLMSIYFYDENNGFIVGKKSTILKYTPDDEIAVTPTEFNAPAAGKEQVITVTSSGEYTVTTDAEWIVPSANRGIGNGTITLTVTKNETIKPRVGVVKFQIGNIIRNVVVSQEPTVPTLTVSQSLVALGAIERRKQTITVTSNIDWTVEDIKVSWIKVNPVKGGGKVTKFDIEADANMLEQSRATSIRVVAGNLSKNIYVSQSGYSAESQILTITPAEVVMTDAAGSAELKVTSNQKWTVQEDDEWLSLNVNKGENNGTVKLTVTENKSSEDRTAIIVFKSDNLVESVKVIQKGKQIETIFEVTPAEITLAYTQGSEADITIKANKAWTASDDAEWLTLSADKGNNDGTIKVTANENTASEDRIATVTLKSGEITKTVKVTQKAYEVFVTINPESLEFTHEKGSKEVTIESNTKWTLTTTNEWITFTKSEGENNGNFNVEVSENNSTQERNGVITVSYGEGKTKTIKVKQAANPSSVAMANDETLVYPNPTEDVLFIKHAETIKSVKVIDARGKVVLSINQLSVNSVHMKDLTAGTYTIVIEDIHGNKLTKKISKL